MAPREKPRRPKQSTGQLMFNTHDPLEEIERDGRRRMTTFASTIKNCLWRSAHRAPQKASKPFGTMPICAAQSVASL